MTPDRRARCILAIDRRAPTPTPEEKRALQEHGAQSWGEYLVDLADNCGVTPSTAFVAFEMLGPTEAFDGLVTTLEDGGDCE